MTEQNTITIFKYFALRFISLYDLRKQQKRHQRVTLVIGALAIETIR